MLNTVLLMISTSAGVITLIITLQGQKNINPEEFKELKKQVSLLATQSEKSKLKQLKLTQKVIALDDEGKCSAKTLMTGTFVEIIGSKGKRRKFNGFVKRKHTQL